MSTPNLFNFATSELSQDAMICYMLQWAEKENKDLDNEAYTIGTKLLDAFFGKNKQVEKPRVYDSVKVLKQYKNIDVLCIVNNEYYIIVEDKTNTSHHSNQLENYFNKINKEDGVEAENILCIYYKSGEEYDLSQLSGETQEGLKWEYKLFSKEDILDVLNLDLKNQIFVEYKNFIKNEQNISSYQDLEVSKWETNSWISFIRDLKDKGGIDDLGKNITHGRGANKGIYFRYITVPSDKVAFYLRIAFENAQLQFKLENEGCDLLTKSLGDKYYNLLEKNQTDNIKIKKSKYKASQKNMTIATLENGFLIKENDYINFEKTKEFINEIIDFHDKLLGVFNKA